MLGATVAGVALACSSTSITPRDHETGGTAGARPSSTGGADAGGAAPGGRSSGGSAGGTEGGVGTTGSGGWTPGGGASPGGAAAIGGDATGETTGGSEPGGAAPDGGDGPGGADTGEGGGGGAPSGGCLNPGHPLVQGLHGCVEDLGGGQVRISYDFTTDAQLLDWFGPSGSPDPTIDDQDRLVVDAGGYPHVAVFARQMRADSLDYRVRLLSGNHINIYVDTVWDGDWAPAYGLGCIHRSDGQNVVVDESWEPAPTPGPVMVGNRYIGSIVASDTTITWTVNDVVHERTYAARTRSTLRNVAIGAYGSEVAFEGIVLEGELSDP